MSAVAPSGRDEATATMGIAADNYGASDGGIIIIICAKETIESNFRERGGEKTHGRASVETKTRRDEEEQQTDEREREQVERRE